MQDVKEVEQSLCKMMMMHKLIMLLHRVVLHDVYQVLTMAMGLEVSVEVGHVVEVRMYHK